MRRLLLPILSACAAGALVLALALTSWSVSSSAEHPGGGLTAGGTPANPLPLTHIHLFTSGVGYFQREGTVEGNVRIDLSFPVHDVNDLLKSLVLQDLDGGRISAVAYDSQDPLDKTLRSFTINLSGNPSYAAILNQVRGEKVEVVLPAGTLTGKIVGIERQKLPAGKDAVVEVDVLNLWCADGMRSVKLADVQRVRFLNPSLDRDIQQALEVLARGHDTQKKTVSLSFAGTGKRRVRIGYVIENPIWKTSYRLVLDGNGKPTLQGWAVVDNPTDEDWSNVRLALVSGRPVSFQMDLYKPIYIPRPHVELDLFNGLLPPSYNGSMDWLERQREALAKVKPDHATPGGPQAEPPVKAGAVGEFFQYALEHPVSLPRQKSALFPILNKEVEGTPVSIYTEATQAKYPLLGLRFKNSTGLHLMQGPVTVFDGGTYAGDARMPELQPGEERLIAFALDQGTEVEPLIEKAGEVLVAVRIDKGILFATTKVREVKKYVVRNRSPRDRVVLIEHPFRPEFKLVSPEKADERARDVYRFLVSVPAGKQASLEVVEERTVVQQVLLTSSDDRTVLRYLSGPAASGALKDALARAVELKRKLEATRREIAGAERQLKSILDDQARLRANLERVPPGSEAYKRYLKKFDDQEVEIEKLQDAIKKLQATEQEQRTAYEEYLSNLSVE
jgi:hypothetical protein